VHKTDSDETFHSVKLHRMVGLNVRKWGFYDKTVKNFKPFCWWDAFRSVWMTQQNAPIISKLEVCSCKVIKIKLKSVFFYNQLSKCCPVGMSYWLFDSNYVGNVKCQLYVSH
jgi:hypothetical protein